MSWFGKKEDKQLLPDLPPLEHDLPPLPERSFEPPVAKTEMYPTLPQEDSFNIKQSLDVKGVDLSDFHKSDEVLHEAFIRPTSEKTDLRKRDEPIYIRLDKFQSTQQSFEEIRAKVEDIEKALVKVKEIKDKEDKELEEWEKEMQMIKSRLDLIDSHLFEQL